MSATPFDILERIIEILDELGIPYALGGSFAASFFGEPRATAGIDVAIVADVVSGDALLERVGAQFYVPEESARASLRSHQSFNLLPRDSAMKVDLFPLGDGLLDRRQISRRVALALPSGRRLWVTSPEDIVLRKLDWFRLGGGRSDRQWTDIVGILRITGERLDREDLVAAARVLELNELLSAAADDAELDL